MASDISRLIFNKDKRYSGVRMQQGRVLLDSDWNAQHDINQYRLHTQTIDVIGKCGVPENTNGFKISQNGNDLEINAGRIYVNGLLCELNQNVLLKNNAGQDIVSDNPSGPPHAMVKSGLVNGTNIIFLDSWQREINFLQDPEIQEKALGEADTTARLQTVWNIGSLPVEAGTICTSNSQLWSNFIAPPTGKLEAKTTETNTGSDPCSPQISGGYTRLENQLYRIEIHKGGSRSQAKFKWSRDNGSVEVKITEIKSTDKIVVESLGKDDVLGIKPGNWVEVIAPGKSLDRETFGLRKVLNATEGSNEIEFEPDATATDLTPFAGTVNWKLKRWDQPSTSSSEGIGMSNNFIDIEDGIQVKFSAGTYRKGDYWLIPARTISSSIEWPAGVAKLPHGIKNGYCKLAVVTVSGGNIVSIEDCRPTFPPLTNLKETGGSCCTYHVSPKAGWESVFDKIADNEDAKICFEIGTFTINKSKLISKKGNLKLIGSGRGTKLIGKQDQTVLRFENCSSVEISDLDVISQQIDSRKRVKIGLKGALTFIDSGNIDLSNLRVKCPSGVTSNAVCVNVFYERPSRATVHISKSKFDIGYYQQGVLVVNGDKIHIHENEFGPVSKPKGFTLKDRLKSHKVRKAIAHLMVSNVSPKKSSDTNETIEFRRHNISFRTHPMLKTGKSWEKQVVKDAPPNIRSKKALMEYVKNRTLEILGSPALLANSFFADFIDKLGREDPSLGYCAITIGGIHARNVQIHNNFINNCLKGIHVGLSNGPTQNIHYMVRSVKVRGNIINNILPGVLNSKNDGRHGIFVGNCESLNLENNEIELNRVPMANKFKIDAIRVWGMIGRKVSIQDNNVFGKNGSSKSYNCGIRVNPLVDPANGTKWNISWNTIDIKGSPNNKIILPSNIFAKYLDTNS